MTQQNDTVVPIDMVARVRRLERALKENITEIKQQSGTHYLGCDCTFCNVIVRSLTALLDSVGDKS